MKDDPLDWKKIKSLFEGLKPSQKFNEVVPLIAIYCFEPLQIKEGNAPGLSKKIKEGKYKYFLNVFKYKEDNAWFYQVLLEIEPADKREDVENYENCFSSEGEISHLTSFLSLPESMFDSRNKKKKIITFKNITLKLQELNKILLEWKKEKTT